MSKQTFKNSEKMETTADYRKRKHIEELQAERAAEKAAAKQTEKEAAAEVAKPKRTTPVKATRTIIVDNFGLTVLLDEKEEGKAFIDYFVNGEQVTVWSKLKVAQATKLAEMATEICEAHGLAKWSY